jgi:microcystin-dependent protein
MATLWQYSRSQARDLNGRAFPGAKAFFFDANTTTPRVVYADNAATTPLTQPVLADSQGRFPAVFLPSGLYRERVTTAGNVLLWDIVEIDPAPTVTTGGGGGSVAANLLFRTGYLMPYYGTGVLDGFVRCAGRTIGSASSTGTERANADAQALFEFLWAADVNLAVSGGRGATANADWLANKALTLPDFRGRVMAGLFDMGNTALTIPSGVPINAGTVTELGRVLGAQTHTLTTPQIPSHGHTATVTDPGHIHTVGVNLSGTAGAGGGGPFATTGSVNTGGTTTGITVSNANTGGGGSHNNMQESLLVTVYVKL